MLRVLLLLVALFVSVPSLSQTAQTSPPCATPPVSQTLSGGTVTLTWTAPTVNTDGSPIAAAITYNLYNVSGTNAQLLLSGISGLSNVRSMLSTATYCYALTAVVNGMESAFSNSVSFVVSSPAPVKPTPNPPTQVVCSVNCASSN